MILSHTIVLMENINVSLYLTRSWRNINMLTFLSFAQVKRHWVTDKFSLVLTRNRPSFKAIGSAGGTHNRRLSTPSTWGCVYPVGGARGSINSCGCITPVRSLTSKSHSYPNNKFLFLRYLIIITIVVILMMMFLGWLGKPLSQNLTWTGCTRPSTLHEWRVTLLSLSSLCKRSRDLRMIPQRKELLHNFHNMHTPQPV